MSPASYSRSTTVNHYSKATPQEKDAVDLVVACVEEFENGIGRDFRDNCVKRYKQYRGFNRFRDAWTKAGPNDKDGMLYDAKKHWGANLHVPLSYRTIESMVPRAVAHRPRMLYLPRQERWEHNVESIRLLMDAQQEQIDIDLPLQNVMRAGRIYGLGIGKCFWRKEQAPRRRAKRRVLRLPGQDPYVVGRKERGLIFDDPDFEDVDPFDFGWDPLGSCMRSAGWVYHRSWVSLEGCLRRIEAGAWNTESAKRLTEDELRSMASGAKYDESWQERMEVSGFSGVRRGEHGEQIHEITEWHDGEQVLTVLDRSVNVQMAENQCVGYKPFQAYRSTPLQKQMVGIGDLEPIEHLQRELDTMRSQRRDAATLALAPAIFFDDAAIEEDEIVFGPAVATRVSNARPSDAVFFAPKPDVPGSSWQDEQVIKADIDAVVGYTDNLQTEQGGSVGTATEAQLVQASLSKRIELSSRRFEIEVVRQAARCWLHMNQRMILGDRDPIRQPGEGLSMEEAYEAGRWRWVPIGPGELQGEFEIIPEGGSMAARNIPQDRQDAQILMGLVENPHLDGRRPLLKALELLGVRDPEGWLKKDSPPVPPAALETLKQMLPQHAGLVDFAVARAQRADPRFPDEGPDVPMMDAAMNGNGAEAPA